MLLLSQVAPTPPHVILMLADDLGNYEVGFHNPRAITPHIDSLAAEGVILERHYVYHCCGPTRSATMVRTCAPCSSISAARLPHSDQPRCRL